MLEFNPRGYPGLVAYAVNPSFGEVEAKNSTALVPVGWAIAFLVSSGPVRDCVKKEVDT